MLQSMPLIMALAGAAAAAEATAADAAATGPVPYRATVVESHLHCPFADVADSE